MLVVLIVFPGGLAGIPAALRTASRTALRNWRRRRKAEPL
jgi:hypothetical protein